MSKPLYAKGNYIKMKLLSACLIGLSLTACKTTEKTGVTTACDNDKLLMAVAWYQHAAEMTALYYQGFNIAQQRLDEALATNSGSKPLAVVVDIDETMLDNSPYETAVILKNTTIPNWNSWVTKAGAKSLPGAIEFVKYAESKNVEIFYITNRDDYEKEATIMNLIKEGFPFADNNHVLTRNDTAFSSGNISAKKGRRTKVT